MEEALTARESLNTLLESLIGLWKGFLSHLPLLVVGVITLVLTWFVGKLVLFLLTRALRGRRFKRGFKDLILQLTLVAVWITGIMVAAIIVFPGMTPAKALAGLGIGSIALGFAFKDVVENFLVGILILWRFPFDPGDFIRYGDIEGMVEEITIRMTLIRRTDGELVVLPNANLFKEPVTVLTNRPLRRITIGCGVAYGEDVDQSREVIHKALETCKTVNQEKPIQIFAREFAESSIDFEVTWWTGATPLAHRQSRDEVVAAVKRALNEAGIEIPFPYRTLTFKEPLRTIDTGGNREVP